MPVISGPGVVRVNFGPKFAAARSSEQRVPFGSALRLGHWNSVQPPELATTQSMLISVVYPIKNVVRFSCEPKVDECLETIQTKFRIL